MRVKLPYLDEENARRRELARVYDITLADVPMMVPRSHRGVTHAYHQYVVRSERRDELHAFLKANSIGTLIHYPVPPHLSGAYAGLGIARGRLPIAEEIAGTALSLPIGPHLSDGEAGYVADCVREFANA